MKAGIKKSNKYGCIYKIEDNTLYQSGCDVDIDWVEVSAFAFNDKERKEFDKYIKKLFGKTIKLNN